MEEKVMRKKLAKVMGVVLIGVLCAGMFTGCGKSSTNTTSTGAGKESTDSASDKGGKGIVVKVGSALAATHPVTVALKETFEKQIEEKTNGKFDIQIYDSGTLGGEKQLYDYTRSGDLQLCAVGTCMWSEVPMMATPDFPFVFRDVAHARKVYQGEVGQYIAENLESAAGVNLLAWCPNGARVFSSSKPLESIDDFKGLKLRMPNNPIHLAVAKALGANAVVMDFGEVFTALEQGVVDGQDNPLSTLRQEGWYEVQKYIYESNHMVASIELLSGNKFMDTLTDEEKAIFEEVAKNTENAAWDAYEKSIDEDREFIKQSGLTVTTPSAEEHAKLVDMMAPVYKDLYAQYDWAEDMVARINAVQ
jgi:tripartite ATP-independent transporter DctP family solute receptor